MRWPSLRATSDVVKYTVSRLTAQVQQQLTEPAWKQTAPAARASVFQHQLPHANYPIAPLLTLM